MEFRQSVEPIRKNELVIPYFGEIIPGGETDERDNIAEIDMTTYLFEISNKNSVDAKYKGNKSRFINHSKKPNLFAENKYSNGEIFVAYYALKDIPSGYELFFNYGGYKEK